MDLSHLQSTFGDFLQYFKDIDFETFLIMKPEHIKEAIPSLGPRIKFENVYEKFLSGHDVILVENPDHKIDVSLGELENESFQIQQLINEISESNVDEAMLESSSKEKIGSQTVTSTIENPLNKIKTVGAVPLKEKNYLRSAEDILNIPSIDLKLVIDKCLKKNLPMDTHERVVIAKAVIHYLLVNDFDRDINGDEFVRLSKIIVEAFPMDDCATYYIPAYKNNHTQGKLYVQYSNYKAQFRKADLCKKRRYIPRRNDEGICEFEVVKEQNDSDEVALKNTFEYSENLEQIRDFWESSYFDRKKLLIELNTNEYMKKFPAFNLYNGYELLLSDGNKILGQRRSSLAETAKKILIYANRQRRPSPELKTLLGGFQNYSQHLQGDDLIVFEQLTSLQLLPYVMANPSRKLSKSESASYFVPYFKTALEADTFKNNHFKPNEQFPRLMLIGEIAKPRTNIYVSDKQYEIENPITGFEVLFHAFLSLNCDFPTQSQHVWEFVSKVIYDFPSDTKKRISSVETFIRDIQNITIPHN